MFVTTKLFPLYLRIFQLYRCLASEDAYHNLELLLLVVDLVDRSNHARESAIVYLDSLTDLVINQVGLISFLKLVRNAEHTVNLPWSQRLRTLCLRTLSAAEKVNHIGRIAKDMSYLTDQLSFHKYIA